MSEVSDYSNPDIKIDTDECGYCKGNSAVRKKDNTFMTSKEYCEEVKTCSATIDWDNVFSRNGDIND